MSFHHHYKKFKPPLITKDGLKIENIKGINYLFMLIKNSSFDLVPRIWVNRNSIASVEFISAKWLRSTHMRCKISRSTNRSSRRVLEAVKSMAGKIRLLANLRSSLG